ncbi:MAG TPA: hypothetical protein VFS54_04660 [Solirubrobacterales bacterium]|nr:hypothetical protein [Solirubrobacterales bacterium]
MFLIQAGHQSSTHIAEGLPEGRADGVIWSPGDEKPELLEQRMAEAAEHDAVQAVDPQLYVGLLEDANPKRLPEYELFDLPLPPRQFSARRLAGLVEGILDFQVELPSTHLIAPTVAVSSMTDRSAQVALNLAETALDLADEMDDERPLFISAAAERSVLADSESVDVLLDELTTHEADGYYLLFEIDPSIDPAGQASLLSEALYITYTLGVIQERPVWVGYAGLSGYLYRAVGAEAFAAGWFQKQQWFSTGHWGPGGGGRAPRSRIYLESILGSLLIDAELMPARRQRRDANLAVDLLRGAGALAAEHAEGGAVPDDSRSVCAAQLFEVCAALDDRVAGDLDIDLERVALELSAAADLYTRLGAAGIELDGRSSGSQITVWQAAIEEFQDRAGI